MPPRPSVDADAPDDEGSGSDGDDRRPPRSTTRSVIEWIAVIGGALVVALVIKTFLIQAFYIPSGSMEPTLDIGDRVLVNKLSYRAPRREPGRPRRLRGQRGRRRLRQPVSEAAATASETGIRDLIKRVVGLPGDTLDVRDNQVLVNDRVLDEPYVVDGVSPRRRSFEFPFEVPEGCIFVMGDNRTDSRDSRIFGPIDEDQIVGRAFVRVWPLSNLGLL